MDVSPPITSLHGRLRFITGTDPAAGVEISETIPDRRRWILHAIRFSLVTDATVANRTVKIAFDNGTTVFFASEPETSQLASSTLFYTGANFGTIHDPKINEFMIPLPPIPLMTDYKIETVTTNLEAGDDFGAPLLLVEEWIDP